jgi:nitronate monooxygenase
LTDQPFNVNLFCHQQPQRSAKVEKEWIERLTPHFERFGANPPAQLNEIYLSFLDDPNMLAVLLEEQPAVVSFHFGLPATTWIKQLQNRGIVTLACVTSLNEAQLAIAAGVDALVAQGIEAGGHRGIFDPYQDSGMTTADLVTQLASLVEQPIIAAGGIMTGADIAAALNAGAAAVQMGTAFVLCPESSANAGYRANLCRGAAVNTEITSAISGRPARGIVNRAHIEIEPHNRADVPDYPLTYDAMKQLAAAAAAQGDEGYAAHWAGTGAGLARSMPAAQLIETLVSELHTSLSS